MNKNDEERKGSCEVLRPERYSCKEVSTVLSTVFKE